MVIDFCATGMLTSNACYHKQQVFAYLHRFCVKSVKSGKIMILYRVPVYDAASRSREISPSCRKFGDKKLYRDPTLLYVVKIRSLSDTKINRQTDKITIASTRSQHILSYMCCRA